MKWYTMQVSEVMKQLDSSLDGLTEQDAQKRLVQYGKNILPKKKKDNIFQIFIHQGKDPILILLMIAAVFSFGIHEWIDGIAIVFIIAIDLIMGTMQEWKANQNAESLSKMIEVKTRVIRSKKEKNIHASNLIPGDIVYLESGDKVVADMRIISCQNFTVNESSLTGESLSVIKEEKTLDYECTIGDQKNMVFAGTAVMTGRATAIVVETGIHTEIGKIADKVSKTKEAKSPLTIRMEKFSKQISILVIIVAILITILLWVQKTNFSTIFLSVIALSVSAMPEGLPLAFTMALTIASNRMSKKNVIVKKLNAVESLGSCTIIASDKTGTLTVNEQTAKKIVLPDGSEFEISGTGYNDNGTISPAPNNVVNHLIRMGVLNNEAELRKENQKFISFGDSIDIAFLALGLKGKVDVQDYVIKSRIPYESENQYSAVFYEKEDITYCTVKGSLEKVLQFCSTMQEKTEVPLDITKLENQNKKLAENGYRVIALASGICDEKIENLTFLGFVAFIDPIRKEVKKSIEDCKTAGIGVLMVTGDHPLTAFTIAKELGLANTFDEVTTGLEVEEAIKKGKKYFDAFVQKKKVFTRVSPLHKLEIVESFKRMGEFIAVTGDGVNDAPAIKAANIGIAMGSGTDVAKETADMIILDDNFTSIVTGIKEGRNAYSNIRKVSYMLLSCGMAEVLFFMLSILFQLPLPLLAVQLLWLNLVTDGLQDLALSFEKAEKQIMLENPKSTKESIFNRTLLQEVLLAGFVIGISIFGVWIYLTKYTHMDLTLSRGYIMVLMVFMQNMHVLNCRSEKQSIFRVSLGTNPLILFSIVSAILLQVLVSEIPILSQLLQIKSIPIFDMLKLFLLSLNIILTMEIYKKIKRRNHKFYDIMK